MQGGGGVRHAWRGEAAGAGAAAALPTAPTAGRLGRRGGKGGPGDRRFGYAMVLPAVLVILLVGLFPLIYSLAVSVQNISLLEEDTSFSGLLNYARLLEDARFWRSLGHTFLFLVVALSLSLGYSPSSRITVMIRSQSTAVFAAKSWTSLSA